METVPANLPFRAVIVVDDKLYIGNAQNEPQIIGAGFFTYIAYADDSDGTGFTTTFDSEKDYIAILTSEDEIETPEASDFTGLWKKYKGEKGDTGEPVGQWQGAWSAGTYESGDIVSHSDELWIALVQTTEEPSGSASDWVVFTSFDPDAFTPEPEPADEDVLFGQRDSNSELIKVPFSSLGGGGGGGAPNLLGLEFDYYDSKIWDTSKTVSDSGQTYVTAHGFDKCLPITLGTEAVNTRRNWTSYMVSQQNTANSQYHHMRFIIDADNWYMVQWDALGRSAVTESVAGVVNQTLYTTLGTQQHRGAHKLWFFSYSWVSNAGWLSVLSQAQGAAVLVPTINMANITHVQFESFRNTDVLGFSEEDHVFRNYGIYTSKITLG